MCLFDFYGNKVPNISALFWKSAEHMVSFEYLFSKII